MKALLDLLTSNALLVPPPLPLPKTSFQTGTTYRPLPLARSLALPPSLEVNGPGSYPKNGPGRATAIEKQGPEWASPALLMPNIHEKGI